MSVFKGKRAVVTGAGSGIGRALALQLADEGAGVWITDIVGERVDEVVQELRARGVEAHGRRVDHSRFQEAKDFVDAVLAEWGGVDVLCSNAGVGHGAALEDIAMEHWEWVLGVNLWGAIYMIHLLAPRMIEREQGWILITSSGLGLMPSPGMAPYTTSKYAMVGLAESLRTELHEHNIKVTALCPGIINTNIVRDGHIAMKNKEGGDSRPKVVDFFAARGADPADVARDGLSALRRDIGIAVTPRHAWPLYLLHRVSPALYHRLARYIWAKGWLR